MPPSGAQKLAKIAIARFAPLDESGSPGAWADTVPYPTGKLGYPSTNSYVAYLGTLYVLGGQDGTLWSNDVFRVANP